MIGFALGVFATLTLAFFGLSIVVFFKIKKTESLLQELTNGLRDSRRDLFDHIDSVKDEAAEENEELDNRIDYLLERIEDAEEKITDLSCSNTDK